MNKYKVGDKVIISKQLSKNGEWIDIPKTEVKVLRVQETISLGYAYTIEQDGQKLNICYWESDIDGFVK